MNRISTAVLTFLLCHAAYAFDVQHFRPVNMDAGLLNLYSSDAMIKHPYNLGVFYNYNVNPIEFGRSDNQRIDEIVNNLQTINFLGSFRIQDYWSLHIDVPIHYLADFDPLYSGGTGEGFSIGDIRLASTFTLFSLKEHGIGWAMIPYVSIPTGPSDSFVAEPHTEFALSTVVDIRPWRDHYFTANWGVHTRDRRNVFNLRLGTSAFYGLGWDWTLSKSRNWHLVSEIIGESPFDVSFKSVNNSPWEALTSIRKFFRGKTIRLDIGAGGGLNYGYGAPDTRLFAGVSFYPKKKKSAKRPRLPEKIVEQPPAPTPTPEPVVEKLAEPLLIKIPKIFFHTNKSTVKESSLKILNGLVQLLQEHKEILKLSIEGHTDSRGDEAYNFYMSVDRAKSVFKYLVEQGVDASRLSYSGSGETKPIAPNDTINGRATNRRVEFKVTEKDGAIKIEDLEVRPTEFIDQDPEYLKKYKSENLDDKQ